MPNFIELLTLNTFSNIHYVYNKNRYGQLFQKVSNKQNFTSLWTTSDKSAPFPLYFWLNTFATCELMLHICQILPDVSIDSARCFQICLMLWQLRVIHICLPANLLLSSKRNLSGLYALLNSLYTQAHFITTGTTETFWCNIPTKCLIHAWFLYRCLTI